MKPLLFCAFFYLTLINCVFGELQTQDTIPEGHRRIQIYELGSHIQQRYHVSVCFEDLASKGKGALDGVFYNPSDFDLSKLSLSETLAKMKNDRVSFITNSSCLIFRPTEFSRYESPLAEKMSPFKLTGSLGELVDYLAESNTNMMFSEAISESDRTLVFQKISLHFNSPVSIEDVLLSLTKEYGITWMATSPVNPKENPLGKYYIEFAFIPRDAVF